LNFESSPVITKNGMVFASTYQGSPDTLYVLDLYNGNVLWSYNSTGTMDYMTPTLVDNVVYFGDFNGTVFAIGKLQVSEEVVVPQRTIEGQAIYDVFNSSGAGLGLFLKYVGYGLMILIPALIVVGIVLVMLKPIKKIFGTA
jgi:outer membrane protein assembly factor BamB